MPLDPEVDQRLIAIEGELQELTTLVQASSLSSLTTEDSPAEKMNRLIDISEQILTQITEMNARGRNAQNSLSLGS